METQPATANAKKMASRIHIGSLIAKEMHQKQISVAWLAEELSFDPSSVYKILRKASIDTELLCRISVALDHNFFDELRAACGFDTLQ